eukprot:m.153434 g.153434  ORF g.153434 m.153434 type:complete len:63 (+) comp38621_c0_seq17:4141-4329(+)
MVTTSQTTILHKCAHAWTLIPNWKIVTILIRITIDLSAGIVQGNESLPLLQSLPRYFLFFLA